MIKGVSKSTQEGGNVRAKCISPYGRKLAGRESRKRLQLAAGGSPEETEEGGHSTRKGRMRTPLPPIGQREKRSEGGN